MAGGAEANSINLTAVSRARGGSTESPNPRGSDHPWLQSQRKGAEVEGAEVHTWLDKWQSACVRVFGTSFFDACLFNAMN